MTNDVKTNQFIEPVDALHRASLDAIQKIRREFAAARVAAARWEPAPMPANWSKGRRTR